MARSTARDSGVDGAGIAEDCEGLAIGGEGQDVSGILQQCNSTLNKDINKDI